MFPTSKYAFNFKMGNKGDRWVSVNKWGAEWKGKIYEVEEGRSGCVKPLKDVYLEIIVLVPTCSFLDCLLNVIP